ncbi:MAG: RNB domain-containing ribonuclease [Gloeomargarita sp. SKYG116]|nr:RNB domain-containing ribonuclease [Gloeomargarita sp. SKYG116]MDW8401675.1 RNB domain-containing ribonuclease [Gloeomargarita sp. SKYGB_i_bin116]
MPFSIGELLGNLPEDKLIAPKVLAKKLFCETESDRLRLKIALDVLTKLSLVTEEFGKYRRVPMPDVVKARLRFSRGSFWAVQEEPGAADIYIPARYLGTAWHGDWGLVKVMRKGRNRRSPEGEVFLVLERAITALVAQVKPSDTGYVAKPMDDRLNITVALPGDEVSQWVDQLVYVRIARYPLAQLPAQGVIKQVLGPDAQSADPSLLVLCKHNLVPNPPAGLPAELVCVPSDWPRQDYRHLATWGLGKLAVSWESGRLGIHIPDGTAYISPETLVDWYARQQGATFGLGNTIYPMTPPVNLGPEWPSISLWVQLDAAGQVGTYRLEPGWVRVDDQPPLEVVASVTDWVERTGQRVGLPMSGAYPLPDEHPSGLPRQENDPAARVAQAVALLANHLLARHLQALQLPGLFRVQPPPDPDAWQRYRFLLQTLGLPVPETLDVTTLLPLIQSHELAPLLQTLFLEILKPPTDSLQAGEHFGLGWTPYLHGVAPLDRYTDLFNQRVLWALFTQGKDRKSSRSKETVDLRSSECHGRVDWPVLPPSVQEELQTQAQQILSQWQERERLHRQAREDYEHLLWLHRCRLSPGQQVRGLIVSVESYGFFVAIERTPLQGRVHVTALRNDWYEFRPQQQALVGRRTNATYAVGMEIDVVVKEVDYYRQQVDLVLPPEPINAGQEANLSGAEILS